MPALAVGDFPKTLPDIIREAAKSDLGILALLIVAVGLLAYVFFRQASERIKVGVFALIFAGAAGYGIAVVRTARAPQNSSSPHDTVATPKAAPNAAPVIAGTVVDAVSGNAIRQARVSIDGSPAATTTDDTGSFRLTLAADTAMPSGDVRLAISIDGYQRAELSIAPPSKNLVVQLYKQ